MSAPDIAEVQAAEDFITNRRAELQAAFEDATEQLRKRIAEHESRERHRGRLFNAMRLTGALLQELRLKIKATEPAVILAICDAAQETGAIDYAPMARLEALDDEQKRALTFADKMHFYLEEAESGVLLAQAEELEAEGYQAETLAEQRAFEFELALVPIAEAEGQIVIDRAQTATGEIRRRGAELRATAAGLREQVADIERKRKASLK